MTEPLDALKPSSWMFMSSVPLAHPRDCAVAILFLGGPQARCTTGHLIPIDGGLTEAFLR